MPACIGMDDPDEPSVGGKDPELEEIELAPPELEPLGLVPEEVGPPDVLDAGDPVEVELPLAPELEPGELEPAQPLSVSASPIKKAILSCFIVSSVQVGNYFRSR